MKARLPVRRAGPSDAGVVRQLRREAHASRVFLIGREPKPVSVDHDHAVRHNWVDLVEDSTGLLALIEMFPLAG